MRTRSLRYMRLAWAFGAAALSLGTAVTAQAAECTTLTNPVFVAGSSAAKPFIAAVATALIALPDPITVIYIGGKASCDGVTLTNDSTAISTGQPSIWNAAGTENNVDGCTLPSAGVVADIGLSDVFPATCGVTSLTTGVKEYLGPIQTMTFVVPLKSTHDSISAEAAYLALGFGDDGEVGFWNDITQHYIRATNSGTEQMLATAIKVPAAKWKATTPDNLLGSSGAVRDKLNAIQASGTQAQADLAIGILATDLADTLRATIKVLPYQHFGQTCGYLPDSTPQSRDKQNVRDGHYAVWGPLHMLTHTTGGQPTNANAKKVLDILSLAETAPFDLLKVEANGGVVPDCAMRVQRSDEVGALSSYFPPEGSCECKFLAEATGTAPDGCVTCAGDNDCPSSRPHCNYDYCEVR